MLYSYMRKKRFWYYGRQLACLIVMLLGMFIFLPGTQADARSRGMHELTYFETSEVKANGREATRVEIGMDRGNLDYEVSVSDSEPNVLQILMKKTRVGEVRQDIKVHSHEVKGVQFRQSGGKDLQARVLTQHEKLAEGDYQVQVLPAERKTRLPYRLAIDIFHGQVQPERPQVAGVAGHTIVLDPGHGGSDSGAVGPDGITEASITLPVARDVRDILQASGAKVVMTRDDDVDVYGPNASDHDELQARVDVGVNTPGTDIFVSIHCNAFSNPAAHGMETYYYPKTDEDYRLAKLLNEELAAAGGRFNRGVKEARFYVMRHSAMPASLVELAFVTNPEEEALLASADYQQKLAMAIARGIARFFGAA